MPLNGTVTKPLWKTHLTPFAVAPKTALKTAIKKFEAAVEKNDTANLKPLFNEAVKKLDQGVSHGIIHKNKAARKKSQLAVQLAKVNG